MQIPRPQRRATSPLLGTLSTGGRMATAGSMPQRGIVLYCLLALLSLLFLASGEFVFEERFDDVSCRRSTGRTTSRSSRNCSRSKKGMTQRTCIPEGWTFSMLPCKTLDDEATTKENFVAIGTIHTKVKF
uniref:Uncharacterized protein n=1 Tax=Zea mays TaxID=4577 RepID=B6U4E3_MAIZE|nr:hypothetical protein [Zea mays]ACG45385.1 hypothetical protein [Zea mays]